MCLHETDSRVPVGKILSDVFLTRNGLKQGDALLSLLFSCALQYVIKKVKVIQDGLKLNGKIQICVMLIMLIYWAEASIQLRKTQKFC
jgi:hypothetical protein